MPLSRRRFPHGVAAAGAATLGLPGAIERAYHFVFVMRENRSFDHYFGALRGVRGFDDPAAPDVFEQYGFSPGIGATEAGFTRPSALHARRR
jgi:phospholipase C